MAEVRNLEQTPLHLGLGSMAVPQPAFTGSMEWYEDYGARTAADGTEGRLVGMHTFTENWASWEMHPAGAEVVLCVAGEMTLIQQFPGDREERVTIRAGEYAINPPGVWHSADICGEATAVFITAGFGTDNRPR